MKKNSVWHVGMDVHAKTIAVALAEPEGTVRSLGTITNEPTHLGFVQPGLAVHFEGHAQGLAFAQETTQAV